MESLNVTGVVADDLDLGEVANLTLSVENCTAIYGNVTLAKAENVTCLAHAPVRTPKVSCRSENGYPSLSPVL